MCSSQQWLHESSVTRRQYGRSFNPASFYIRRSGRKTNLQSLYFGFFYFQLCTSPLLFSTQSVSCVIWRRATTVPTWRSSLNLWPRKCIFSAGKCIFSAGKWRQFCENQSQTVWFVSLLDSRQRKPVSRPTIVQRLLTRTCDMGYTLKILGHTSYHDTDLWNCAIQTWWTTKGDQKRQTLADFTATKMLRQTVAQGGCNFMFRTYPCQRFDVVQCVLSLQCRLSCEEGHETASCNKQHCYHTRKL